MARQQFSEEPPSSLTVRRWPAALDEQVRHACATWRVSARREFLQQGTVPDAWIGVVTGMVELTYRSAEGVECVVDFVGPGRWIGGAQLLARLPLPFSAVALGETRLLVMRRSVLLELVQRHAELMAWVMEASHRQMERLAENLALRSYRSVDRVNTVLHDLALQCGGPAGPTRRLPPGLTQSRHRPLHRHEPPTRERSDADTSA